MRVLLTGATGYLGRRIARKLAIKQHEVVALAYSHDQLRRLGRQHVPAVLCPLDDADRLQWYAARADGFIHAAGSQSAGFPEIIERALGVVELALPDGAPCVSIEGPIAALAAQDPAAMVDPPTARSGRRLRVRATLVLGQDGPGGLARALLIAAFRHAESGVVGPGTQRIPAVMIEDLVELMTGALHFAPPGLHTVDAIASAPRAREISEAVAAALCLGSPVTWGAQFAFDRLGRWTRWMLGVEPLPTPGLTASTWRPAAPELSNCLRSCAGYIGAARPFGDLGRLQRSAIAMPG